MPRGPPCPGAAAPAQRTPPRPALASGWQCAARSRGVGGGGAGALLDAPLLLPMEDARLAVAAALAEAAAAAVARAGVASH